MGENGKEAEEGHSVDMRHCVGPRRRGADIKSKRLLHFMALRAVHVRVSGAAACCAEIGFFLIPSLRFCCE